MVTTPRPRPAAAPSKPAHTCTHAPPCPAATQPGRLAAIIIAAHPEQGWNLLCNGLVVFDDTGYLSILSTLAQDLPGQAALVCALP